MAANIALSKQARKITTRDVYTPSRSETQMNYKMNEKTELEKKLEDAKRDNDVEIKLKRGTLVMTFTAGAYELYKEAIYSFYDHSDTKTYCKNIKTSKTNKSTHNKAVMEESLSMKLEIEVKVLQSSCITQQVVLMLTDGYTITLFARTYPL